MCSKLRQIPAIELGQTICGLVPVGGPRSPFSAPRLAQATRSEAETAKALAAKEKREGPDERLTMNEIWKAGEGASAREGEANARFLGAEVFFCLP